MTYSASDLVKIINACAKSGVYELILQEMHLKFDTNSDPHNFETLRDIHVEPQNPQQIDEETNEDEQEISEPVLELLAANNPALYEEYISRKMSDQSL